ncbi:RNB family domain-containing protein [Cardiosporidium cionae]|uniref:RNB family domain-containing protein n=1 Tax=Cardiosporidium cionae TaxID=476202 RepID=A0ABQ7JCM8_9APIC|nr:RNB family domain-containing protein [Cardiosporidium cionae]|eukprot:KAF8821777.1 RNB family domain-containing protein [Cardiosporidium cionae]
MSKIDTFLSKLEIDHNFTSSGAIQGSLLSIAENYGNLVSAAIEVLLRKPMSRANYFIMDKNLKKSSHHFALNFKYYTHFTSPIRRYADLLVHRLLWETISNKCIQKGENSLFMDIHPRMTKHILENQCTLCNYKRMKAKDASLACEWAFFCSYLRSLPHPCITVAVPCSIFSSSVEVCLPRLGRQAQLSFSPDTCLMDALSQRSKDRLKFPYSILFVNTHKINIFWTSEDCNNNQAQSLKILSCIPVFILPSTTSYTELFVSVIPPQDLLFQDQAGKLDALILGEISTKAFHLPEKFQDELNMPLKSLTEVSPKAT